MDDAAWLRDMVADDDLDPEIRDRLNRIANKLRALDKPTEADVERVSLAVAPYVFPATRKAGWSDTLYKETCDKIAAVAIAALQDGV